MSMSHKLASAAAVAFHREGVNTIMKSEIERRRHHPRAVNTLTQLLSEMSVGFGFAQPG